MTQTAASTLFQYVFESSICFISYSSIPENTLRICCEEAEQVLSNPYIRDIEPFSSMDNFIAEFISVSSDSDVIQQIKQKRRLDRKFSQIIGLFRDMEFLTQLARWLVLGKHGDGERIRATLETRMIRVLESSGTHQNLQIEFKNHFFSSIERHLIRNSSLATWQREALKKMNI